MCVPTYAGGVTQCAIEGWTGGAAGGSTGTKENGCRRVSVAPALLWRPKGTLARRAQAQIKSTKKYYQLDLLTFEDLDEMNQQDDGFALQSNVFLLFISIPFELVLLF